MRRSILMSVMAIGAAIAIVTGASTFATFTDQATASSQTLTAGRVDLTINTTQGNVNITLGGSTCPSPGTLAFGEECTATYTVENAGTNGLSFVVSKNTVKTDADNCYSITTDSLAAGIPDVGDADTDLNPGQAITGTISVKLDAQGSPVQATQNACQGKSASVAITVTATQSPSPHD